MVESSAPGNGESTPPTSPSTPSPTPATPEIESVEAADPGQPLAGTHGGTATAPEATTAEPTGEPPIEPEAESPGLQVSPEPVATGEPTFISSIEVPASPTAVGEGGEWELLTSKISQWLEGGQLQRSLQSARTPLLALGALMGLVLVLRVYGALLGAIESLPLVSGLLELAGVIWLARFAAANLVRSSERQRLLSGLQRRWKAFFGND